MRHIYKIGDSVFKIHEGPFGINDCEIHTLLHLVPVYIYAFSRCSYPKRLAVHSGYTVIVSMCSLGIEPMTDFDKKG